MPVQVVVVTYNRKQLLVECLEALARQTLPPERVIVVDNASTDGSEAHVAASGVGARLPLTWLRLRRNGGGSEGFHYGVREALRVPSEWIWLMDDDCEPAGDALERLLRSPRAQDASTAALVPVVRTADGEPLPMHRGHITPRLVRAPIVALTEEDGETECDFASFVGPLFRTEAVRAMGLPLREAFIRFEDLEYSARLRRHGRMWLVPESLVVHKEAVPVTGSDLRTLWRDFARPTRFEDQWKNVYGSRNVIFAGRRHGFVSAPAALSYVALQTARTLLFDPRKLRTAYLLALYAYDGWRGRFRNVPPGRWPGVADASFPPRYLNAEALRYDVDVAERPTAQPTPAA